MIKVLIREMAGLADPKQAAILSRFFKTGPGQYGEGDVFLGIKVPVQRAVAGRFNTLGLPDLAKLLSSPVHEHRLVALIILNGQYKNEADGLKRDKLFEFYLGQTKRINNWDLVDLSAPNIVGAHLLGHSRRILYDLAGSPSLWERRIAIVSTISFIRAGELDDTFKLARILINDKHDLIHKAAGWMLREAGKRDEAALKAFLEKYAAKMPRTMLRYAIERLSDKDRRHFLKKT